MKKHTIELKRYQNSPIGYGIMHPLDGYKAYEKSIDYCLVNDLIYNHHNVRTMWEAYTDGRFIRSTGWSCGGNKLSHEYFCGCELCPEKITGWRFGENIVYLDIYYSDHDSLLEENVQLKKVLKELNEKYNGTQN